MRVLVTGITGQVGSHLIASQAPPGVTWLPADRARLNLSEPEAIRAVLDRLAPRPLSSTAPPLRPWTGQKPNQTWPTG